jgi:hypothetical protein
MSDTSLLFNIIGRDKGATSTIARTSAAAKAANSGIRASSIAATAGTVGLGVAMAGAAAHAVALGSAVLPAVNVIGLLPGLGVAAAAGLGVMKLALGGLAENWKYTGGAATNSSRQIAAAEDRVAAAQRAAKAAQDAINIAREEAVRRQRDLTLSLNGARLDEEAAVRAVAVAQNELARTQQTGDVRDIAAADLAYRQSLQTLDEVRARLSDLSTEQADAAKKGVEGSDGVQAALQHQADATRELADAQRALKEARSGSGGGGPVPPQLAGNARAFLAALKQLRPEWQAMQRSVQQRVFAGLSGEVKQLSGAYLPKLTTRLGDLGGSFNRAIREAAGLAGSKKFVADVNATLGNTNVFADRLGRALTPILSGLRNIGTVGATFLPQLGSGALTLAQRFERWTAAARESGKLKEWIGKGLGVLRQLGQIAGAVGGTIMAIFHAGDNGGATLDGLVRGAQAMRDWAASADGQAKIASVLSTLRGLLTDLGTTLGTLGPALVGASGGTGLLADSASVLSVIMKWLADHTGLLAAALPIVLALMLSWKAVQVASLPIDIARIAAMWRMGSALKANTAAMGIANGVEKAGMLTRVRSAAALVAQKVAMVAVAVATKVWTAAQWLLDAAMSANPLGLIIAGIIILIGVIVLIATKTTWFQTAWRATWSFLKMVGAWFAGPFAGFFVSAWHWIADTFTKGVLWVHTKLMSIVHFVTSLPGRIRKAAKNMWNGIIDAYKGAMNWLATQWNKLDIKVSFTVPDWVPVYGGRHYETPDLLPDLPMLERGGQITRGGAAIVADRNGQGGEVVSLPTGATVTPLSSAAGATTVHLVIDLRGGDAEMRKMFRRMIRADGGSNVTFATA